LAVEPAREDTMTIDTAQLKTMLLGLVTEAYDGPADPRMTWFADNEAGSGLLGTLGKLSAAEASKPFVAGDTATAATHAGHLRFALNLANRALRGEDVHATADWKASWKYRSVDGAAWKELISGLRSEYKAFLAAIDEDLAWSDIMNLTGVFSQLAHGAWHLGAIRQGLGLISTPKA
jgi:hypothetical protein